MTSQKLEELGAILAESRIIAVVGLSPNPERESHSIAHYLQQQGYRIIPVNPKAAEILGEKSYLSLRDIPELVDVVLVFRKPEAVPSIVEDAIAIGAKVIWMQVGIVHEAASKRARSAGMQVVMNTCMRATHKLLQASDLAH
ncbi:MAG: CoA-binding protein [Anaerolineales bacterium]